MKVIWHAIFNLYKIYLKIIANQAVKLELTIKLNYIFYEILLTIIKQSTDLRQFKDSFKY